MRGRRVFAGVASACAALAILLGVAVAIGSDGVPVIGDAGGSNSASGDRFVLVADGSGDGAESGGGEQGPDGGSSLVWISAEERVDRGEALPCTGPEDPTNFEVYSAGPSVAGLPLTEFKRRCGATTPVDEPPANFTNYIYGDCQPAAGSSSCVPPLEIQTWPACERSLADYTYGGKPMPYRRLASDSRADVVEIQFEFEPRVEVYSKASTIVIFAEDLALAEKAVAQLTSQEIGNPPATKAGELKGQPDGGLAPPSDGATEGELSC